MEATTSQQDFFPLVSIAVITKDRREDLLRLLESLAGLDYPRDCFEVVLLEEADTDLTCPLPPYIHYHRIPRENRGYGYARNRSVELCRHDLVAFTDDDCRLDPAWLRELVAPLVDPLVAGVAGAVRTDSPGAVGQAEIVLGFPGGGLKRFHLSGGRVVPTGHLSTCNCLYRKAVLREVGVFRAAGSEDFELAERITARHRCVYAPRALLNHRARGSLSAVLWWFHGRGRQQVYLISTIGRGRWARLCWNLGTSLTLRAATLVLLAGLTGLIGLLPPALLGYYLALVWRYRFSYRYLGRWDVLWVTPLVKVVMDLGLDSGKLHQSWRLLVGRRDLR